MDEGGAEGGPSPRSPSMSPRSPRDSDSSEATCVGFADAGPAESGTAVDDINVSHTDVGRRPAVAAAAAAAAVDNNASSNGGLGRLTVFDEREITGDPIALGDGGFGSVLRIRYGQERSVFAIKFLREASSTSMGPDGLRRMSFALESELLALVSLQHPHILQLFGRMDYRGTAALVTEFASGGTLLSCFVEASASRADTPLGVRMALCAQLAQAVAYVHGRNMVHYDIKPENVLLAAGDVVKLADFGLASESGSCGGTRTYCAPEILMREPGTSASDVYSLGVTVMEVLAGRRAFKSADRSANAYAAPTGIIECIQRLLQAAAGGTSALGVMLVARCIHTERERRPRAVELLDLLDAAASASVTAVAAPAPADPTPAQHVVPSASAAVNHRLPIEEAALAMLRYIKSTDASRSLDVGAVCAVLAPAFAADPSLVWFAIEEVLDPLRLVVQTAAQAEAVIAAVHAAWRVVRADLVDERGALFDRCRQLWNRASAAATSLVVAAFLSDFATWILSRARQSEGSRLFELCETAIGAAAGAARHGGERAALWALQTEALALAYKRLIVGDGSAARSLVTAVGVVPLAEARDLFVRTAAALPSASESAQRDLRYALERLVVKAQIEPLRHLLTPLPAGPTRAEILQARLALVRGQPPADCVGAAFVEALRPHANMAARVRVFVELLLTEGGLACGVPPCAFALVGLGSYARGEMCPFSDVDAVLLVERGDEETVRWFREVLMRRFALDVAALGETAMPNLIGCGEVCGFQLDRATLTPLVQIRTPADMAAHAVERLTADSGDVIGIAFLDAALMGGAPALLVAYDSELRKRLPRGALLAVVQGNVAAFRAGVVPTIGDTVDVKARLCRPLSLAISGLARLYGVEAAGAEDRIAALVDRCVMDRDVAAAILRAWRLAFALRTAAHAAAQSESDAVAVTADNRADIAWALREVVTPMQAQLDALLADDSVPVFLDAGPFADARWDAKLDTVSVVVGLSAARVDGQFYTLARPQPRCLTADALASLRHGPRVAFGRNEVTRIGPFHFKREPELPGNELAVRALGLELFGELTPAVDIAEVFLLAAGPPVRFLMSETVEAAMVRDADEAQLAVPQLSLESFGAQAVLAMLTSPEDHKGDNVLLDAGGRLWPVDNDHAFVRPFLEAKRSTKKAGMLAVKTWVFCMDAMREPLPERIVALLIRRDVFSVIDCWLRRLVVGQSEGGFVPGLIVKLFDKLSVLRAALADPIPGEARPTLLGLLGAVEPQLARVYGAALDSGGPVATRFRALTAGLYNERADLGGRTVQVTMSSAHDIVGMQDRFEGEAAAAERVTIARLRSDLDGLLRASVGTALTQLVESGGRDVTLLSRLRVQVLSRIDMAFFEEKMQERVLKALHGAPLRFVELLGATALTSRSLQKLLSSVPSADGIESIALSRCSALTCLPGLDSLAPRLRELSLLGAGLDADLLEGLDAGLLRSTTLRLQL